MWVKLKNYIKIIYQKTQVMNSFYRSPLNQTNKITNQNKSDLLKRWTLLKEQPISAIFRFPKSCLDDYTSQQKNKTMKKQRSKSTMQEKTIELGKIGKQMQNNVRQTIMNQTRTNFSPLNTAKSSYLSRDYNPSKDKDDAFRTMQQQSNKKTMRLLQKAIMQQDRFFYLEEDLLNLHTNKLPILKKQYRQRKKRPLRKMDLQSSKFIQTSRQKHKYNIKTPSSAQLVAVKKQKPEIRGWDTIQLHDM